MREEDRVNQNDQLSTADLAAAADRAETRTERDLNERVVDREVSTDAATAEELQARSEPLLPRDSVVELRERWVDIQASFVDEPRRAVEQADGLVADAIKRLAESFAGERSRLEGQWDRGGDVSTEDLRQALQRYRAFFSRLLSA
ncbi:MAG TPA: hypothetical protein VJ672_09965 [Gemmatimonadaceae bacterium]|nr:hypothetical protein [Gemmatimonadaceae bacterium]